MDGHEACRQAPLKHRAKLYLRNRCLSLPPPAAPTAVGNSCYYSILALAATNCMAKFLWEPRLFTLNYCYFVPYEISQYYGVLGV